MIIAESDAEQLAEPSVLTGKVEVSEQRLKSRCAPILCRCRSARYTAVHTVAASVEYGILLLGEKRSDPFKRITLCGRRDVGE